MGCCYSNSNHFNDIDFEYGKEVAEKYKQSKKYTNTEKSDLLFNIYPSNQQKYLGGHKIQHGHFLY